jgi:hypothetical protein
VIHENIDGTYELSINERGFYLKPTIFMDCDTDETYINAINMTIEDVHAFCNAVHDSDVKKIKDVNVYLIYKKGGNIMSFKYHFCTLNSVYTVYIRERLNGTYELSISEKGIYINPKIFIDCKTRGLTTVNMTIDDVNAFCDAVRDSDLTNKKQYCLFNI